MALLFLGAIVVLAALGLPPPGQPGAISPGPTVGAEAPTADAPTQIPNEAGEPSQEPSAQPSGDVVAYTNPDGISTEGYAGDDYPFIAEAQTLPTYGILWVDPNQRDFHIGLTGDIEGAIEALKDGIPRGITVYFYIVQHTDAEICAIRDAMFDDREELMRHGIVLMSGGCGNMEMRVNVGMSPLTPESVAYMEARYAGPVDYEDAGGSALRPYEPPEHLDIRLEALRQDDGFGWLTCGRQPFADSALAAAPIDVNGPGPALAALRESLSIYIDLYGDLSGLRWIAATQDDYGATYLTRQGERWLEAPVFAGRDGWVPGTIDDCTPREFGAEYYADLQWSLDPDFATPNAASTELHVLVVESACASGEPPLGRVLPPIVDYAANELHLTIGVRHRGGFANCPSNPSLAVTVVLPEPIGDRELTGDTPPRF